MAVERMPKEEKPVQARKPPEKKSVERRAQNPQADRPQLARLQRQVGNRAVQRLLAQRSGDGSFELDEGTIGRINRERGSGQALDSGVQREMGEAMGHDFSDVRVHTSAESDDLNQQVGARAFTTGRDIFLREGAYNPQSGEGRKLLAHELTHVVQQSAGEVSGGPMTVNPPGDVYEQEADAVAKTVTGAGDQVQRQAAEEEEELPIQAQAAEEEEEFAVQTQAEEEEEELPVQTQAVVQRQEEFPEEEEL